MAIDYEKHGHIRIMRFNNPEKRNALGIQDFLDWDKIEDEFVADDDAWVLIMTGAGDKSFSAGADLSEAIGAATSGAKLEPRPRRWFSHCYKPIIAAINGYALAGGTEFIELADIRIAAEHAMFGIQEVRWGLVPLGGSCAHLTRQIPFCKAMEMLLIGDRFTAQQALEMGLINKVVPKEELMPTAMATAERICENGPVAVRLVKEIALKSIGLPREMSYLLEYEIGAKAYATEDAKEGPLAFFEKRKPNFKNR
ncbi:MAG: enoyl-CoA hydratase/isomerase family protein [Chloroflexi bacterium]|nr:enoyl-CoA hydratase/isomerase family protein [Chloroflexota bacterium]